MQKYIVSRTSNSEIKPCKGAIKETVEVYHWSLYDSLEEVRKHKETAAWFFSNDKFNQIKIKGTSGVRCSSLGQRWVVEVASIEDFFKMYGQLVINPSGVAQYPIEIEIYDDWRE